MNVIVGRPPAVRRALLIGMTVVFSVAVVEVLSVIVLGVIDGRLPTWSRLQRERAAVVAADGLATAGAGRDEVGGSRPGVTGPDDDEVSGWMLRISEQQVLHPYVGYVEQRLDDEVARGRADRNAEAGRFGFPRNRHGLFHEPRADRLVVVVVGGSFSRQISFGGERLLESGLEAADRFRGREVIVISLGLGGYKQPQQLMIVNYFLALGMHVDVLVNIDGFNEVVLPVIENLELGVNPFFPRGWSFRVADFDPDELRLRGQVGHYRAQRSNRAAAFAKAPWRNSMSCSLLWRLLDRRSLRLAGRAEAELRSAGPARAGYQALGPDFEEVSETRTAEHLVEVWQRCSLLLDTLCRANGIEYYHFLQPNQYIGGSKPLSGAELREAVRSGTGIAGPVARGYPLMRAAATDLRSAGVAFHDLTNVFADVAETLYIDDCCHVNALGIERVAERIVETIARGSGFADRPPSSLASGDGTAGSRTR